MANPSKINLDTGLPVSISPIEEVVVAVADSGRTEPKKTEPVNNRTDSDAPGRQESRREQAASLRNGERSQITKDEMLVEMGRGDGTYHPMHMLPMIGRPIEDMQAFIDMKGHFLAMVTPVRLGVALFIGVLSILGVFFMDPTEFKIQATIPNVKDFAACVHMCELSSSDDDLATKLGGKGICGPKSAPTVEFKYCEIDSKKLKVKNCKKFDNATAAGELGGSRCRFDVAPDAWKPYVTVGILAVAIVCCFQNGPPDVLLMGGGAILCALGVVDRKQYFNGLANSGVIGLAMLMPIAAAISETGLLEKAVGVMLGQPKSLGVAILRMMFPVALMSACLSNTATVAMLIPIIVGWARRLEVHPGKMLMPLSFAAQLGGSMTLLGSSHCLVAANAIPSDLYEMGFFDLAPLGTLLMICTCFIIWAVVTKTPLLHSSAQGADAAAVEIMHIYDFKLNVVGGGLVNQTIEDSGLKRLPGVVSVQLSSGDDNALMKAGDVLITGCNARGVVELRGHPGLEPLNKMDLGALGRARHRRFMYEVDVHAESEFATDGIPSADELRNQFGACFVAGPRHPVTEISAKISGGSVLLLEADERAVGSLNQDAWAVAFTLVNRVHRSSPLRHGLPVDRIRGLATFAGFLVLIACTTVKVVKFDYGGVLLCLFYLAIRSITLDQFMQSFKVQILMTIVGALAMGTAMESSGVVNFLAQKMIDLAKPLGTFGLTACVYLAAVFLSMFINNSATVAILAPMIKKIAETDDSVDIQGLVWTLVYAAGTCFMTPLGYQTNLMVMPEGKYTFGDFARFGVPTQVIHFGLVLVFVLTLGPSLYPSFG